MDRLLPILEKERIEKNNIEVVQQQEKKTKLIGKSRRIPGHTLFSYNKITGEVKEAKYINEAIMEGNRLVEKRKLLMEKDCIYGQALNKKNYIKKLSKCGIEVLPLEDRDNN